jgi:hypothetical protein
MNVKRTVANAIAEPEVTRNRRSNNALIDRSLEIMPEIDRKTATKELERFAARSQRNQRRHL